jgi:outer membrane scaffolding protein for murein synthesis (MipA/OmpV family)
MALRIVLALVLALFAGEAAAQTPSPLAYWQYSVGELLGANEKMKEPGANPWDFTVGGGAMGVPKFEGAKHYQGEPSLILDARYKDIFFASDGEGVGVNLVHGQNYRAGVAIGYDLGRDQHDDARLKGLGNVGAAPEGKLFAEYFLLPVMLTATVHQAIGGHNGLLADLGAYIPLPFFDDKLIVFTGPTVTFANGEYMRSYFGVSARQAAATAFPQFSAHGGFKSTGWGATAVYRIDDHWLLESDIAYERLIGDAADSPIVELRSQVAVGLNLGYRF